MSNWEIAKNIVKLDEYIRNYYSELTKLRGDYSGNISNFEQEIKIRKLITI